MEKSTPPLGDHCLTPRLVLKIYPNVGLLKGYRGCYPAMYVIRHPARARFEDIEVTPEELLDFREVLKKSKMNVRSGRSITEIGEFKGQSWDVRVAEMLSEPVIYDEKESYYATQLVLYFAKNATTSRREHCDVFLNAHEDHVIGFFFDARSVYTKIPSIDGFGFREFELLIDKCNKKHNDGYSCRPETSVIDRYYMLLAYSSLGHEYENIVKVIRERG